MAVVLNKTQYETIAESLATQYAVFGTASSEAQVILQYIVELDDLYPSLDLLQPFYTHAQGMGASAINNFRTAVGALQNHVISRSGTDLNTYLGNNLIKVSPTFAELSSGLGFPIDPSHILP
jgi:hypothetical protein